MNRPPRLSTLGTDGAVAGAPRGRGHQFVAVRSAGQERGLAADLRQALRGAEATLNDLLQRSDRDGLLREVFGNTGTGADLFAARAERLWRELATGLHVAVELLPGEVLEGALGAYAAVAPDGRERIYVNATWLASLPAADREGALVKVLLEEFGHALDQRLNPGMDSPGDEGALFAALVSGAVLTKEQRAAMATENDSALLVIDGVQVAVEEANVNATSGTDNSTQGSTDDTFTFTNSNQVQSGDRFDGGGGTDTIVISSSTGLSINFSSLDATGTSGFLNMEAISFTNSSGTSSATFNAAQFGAGKIASTFAITAAAGIQNITVNLAAGGSFNASAFTFSSWTAATDTFTISGSSGAETISGSSQADAINGAAGNDNLSGGAGADTITGGTGADTLTGGSDIDAYTYSSGATALTISGTGSNGSISGFDVILDFNPGSTAAGSEKINFSSASIRANTSGRDGSDSTLLLNTGAAARSHAITGGIVSFDDANSYSAPVSLASLADIAAAVQYLQNNDLGSAGTSVAFTATLNGQVSTFVYIQPGNSAGSGLLIELDGVAADSLSTSGLSNQIAVLDSTAPAVAISSIGGADSVVSSQASDNAVVGTADPSRTVTLFFGATQLGTTTANASGNFSYTLTAANLSTIGQGNAKSITASQTDAAGNTGTSAAFSFSVDTLAPTTTASIGSVVDDGGANGNACSVALGAFTDDTTPTFSGTLSTALAAGESVVLHNGSTLLGTATVNGTNWFFTPASALPLGASSITAKVSDGAGNLSTASSPTTFTLVDRPSLALASGLGSTLTSAQLTSPEGVVLVQAEVGTTVRLTFSSSGAGSTAVEKFVSASGLSQAVALTSAEAALLTAGTLTVTATTVTFDGSGNDAATGNAPTPLSVTYVPDGIVGSLSIATTTNGDESGPVATLFTVSRTGDLSQPATVTYTLGGTAIAGSPGSQADYVYADPNYATNGYGTLTFTAGSATTTLSLPSLDNSVVNGSRTLTVSLNPPSNYSLAAGSATASLLDNDTAVVTPVISVAGASLLEGTTGDTTTAVLTVSLDRATTAVVTVAYSFTSGTATAGSDYSAVGGSLTFQPGSTQQGIPFSVLGDTLVEGNETFTLTLSAPTNATVSATAGSATVTLLDDDSAPPANTPTNGADNLTGTSGVDALNGLGGADTLTGLGGADTLTGDTGADRFRYVSAADSTLAGFDVISDFDAAGGDRVALAAGFDGSLQATGGVPSKLWNAGVITAGSLSAALSAVYTDANRTTGGNQALALGEAVLFTWGSSTLTRRAYVAVNGGDATASGDLVIRLAGYTNTAAGVVPVADIFTAVP